MTLTRTTIEMRQGIAARRERGMSYRAIAMLVGVSVTTVRHWCLELGAEPPGLPRPPSRFPARPVMRGGRPIHPFTPDEDALMQAMRLQGFGRSEIARHMTKRWPDRPRNPATIKYRLLTLARQEERRMALLEAA